MELAAPWLRLNSAEDENWLVINHRVSGHRSQEPLFQINPFGVGGQAEQ